MGAGQSSTSAAQAQKSHALHVLRVTASSPASQTSIEPFFDFIVGFDGSDAFYAESDIDAIELERIVEEHEEKTLNLLVWNSKTRTTRVVPIVPSRAWALTQQASIPQDDIENSPQPSLLGLSMRMCEFENATNNVWHVLEVLEGSPAESAGLVPYGDWIIGWSGGILTAENDFYDVVEAHVDKPLRVYVYSYDFDNLREVVLVPNRHWGGEGLLGCVFGFGLLHRIPSQTADGGSGAVLQNSHSDFEDQQLFVPADVSQGPQSFGAEDRRRPSFGVQRPSDIAHPRPTHYNQATQGRRPAGDILRRDSASTASRPGTPRRSTNTPNSASQAPTASRSFGSLLNGTGVTATFSGPSPSALQFSTSMSTVTGMPQDDEEDEENSDRDGTVSVSGTEATDYGSLTSVE
ncbi:GRASP55/65 PDZ-like domain-containing protein [Suillus subalutaceus]|uniref:GRASP55/65 PDZ-like domain-containing protein n=1 Tax=Suillus subalutaceus TaxID=48586 RepID=UPI001B867FF5|nr:GRASP55/65 PDZ-like domain-containing protein [Suillus subalutaceus]KAG1872357.1 GRASP55/65 PDZ-like domain-containing protein [Suillus subalutaceus]